MKTYLRRMVAATLGACACAGAGNAAEGTEMKSETAMTSYALGYQIGGDFKRQRLELDVIAVVRGIADAHGGVAPAMTEEAMRHTLIELKRKVMAQELAAMEEAKRAAAPAAVTEIAVPAAPAAAAPPAVQFRAKRASPRASVKEKAFLERNAKGDGVVTLASGLQYKVRKEGSGRQPQPGDRVALIYRGALASGAEFGHSEQEGKPGAKVVPLAELVPGLREALLLMKEGAEWQVVVPPQLGFDARTPLFSKVTVFDVQLVGVNP